MKMNLGMKAMVINVKEDEFVGRDGKPVKNYKIALEQDGEVASFPCAKEVFEKAVPLQVNNLFACYSETEFDGKVIKRFSISGVASAK